jgi:hypothetical protein
MSSSSIGIIKTRALPIKGIILSGSLNFCDSVRSLTLMKPEGSGYSGFSTSLSFKSSITSSSFYPSTSSLSSKKIIDYPLSSVAVSKF